MNQTGKNLFKCVLLYRLVMSGTYSMFAEEWVKSALFSDGVWTPSAMIYSLILLAFNYCILLSLIDFELISLCCLDAADHNVWL